MPRLERQYFLPGITREQALGSLTGWLVQSGFRVLTTSSDGVTNQYRAPEVHLQFNPGQAVLNLPSAPGSVIGLHTTYEPRAAGWAFVAVLRAEERVQGSARGTMVAGSFFFAPPEGVNTLGRREWTPSPSIWGVGGVIRAKAWPLILSFEAAFGRGGPLPLPPPPTAQLPAPPLASPGGPSAVGATATSTMTEQVAKTSAMQTVDIVVVAATTIYTYMSILLLFVLLPLSIFIFATAVSRGFSPPLFGLLSTAILAGALLLAYSVYLTQYRILRPLRRGQPEGVANRTLAIGIGAIAFGSLLGYGVNFLGYLFSVAGLLYIVAYLRLRNIPVGSP